MLKKIILFFCVTIAFGFEMVAQPKFGPTCSFSISSETKQSFWLFLDDVLQNENPVRSMCVNGVLPGDHYVRIELDNSKHNTVGQFLSFNKSNNNFCIIQKSGFFGISAFNASIYPEMTVNFLDNNPQLPPPPSRMEMRPNDFEEAYNMVAKENFDSSRLNMAKQISDGNALTVNQIKRICNLFSFENNKLEFAKYAYGNCVDKNNYFKINEVFKFNSDKQQLSNFINQQ